MLALADADIWHRSRGGEWVPPILRQCVVVLLSAWEWGGVPPTATAIFGVLVTSIHRVATGVMTAVVAVVVLASPAAAHTGFESSDPADGATLDIPLDIITLVFTGEAEPTADGFQVLDPSGELRQPTEATTTDGLTWVLRFDPPISGGDAGMRWMVKAPDAHPIDGSFSFTVTAPAPTSLPDPSAVSGADAATPAVPTEQPDLESFLDTGTDPTKTPLRVGAAGRMITLAGTLIGVGALVFAAAVLRGERRDVRHVLHWVRRAGLLVAFGATVELVAQLAVDSGGEWSAILAWSTISSVFVSSFGIAVALRVAGGLAMVSGARIDITHAIDAPDPVVAIRELVGAGAGPSNGFWVAEHHANHGRESTAAQPYLHEGDQAWFPTVDSAGALLGGLAVLVAHLFDGHTVTKGDRLFTGAVDFVHVAGGAVWVGGVLMLTSILWRRHRQGRELRALQLAVRFSVVATLALVAVGAAGLVLTVIVLDSPSELWATEWGRLLLLKTVFVGAAGVAGGYNHRVLIPQMGSAPDDAALTSQFRTVVTGEAIALVAVLVVTALLMGAAS